MTGTTAILRLVGALSVAAVILSGLPVTEPHQLAGRYRSRTQRVAPGVTLSRMVDRDGPNRISVLRVDLAKTTIDVALSNNALPGLQTVRAMAERRDAIAAINGDYFFTHGHEWTGRPVNTYAEDAALKASPMIWGRNLAISADESDSFLGHFRLRITITEYDTGRTHAVEGWNAGPPSSDELAGFTPAGGSAITPPSDACAVRLVPSGTRQWHPASEGVVQDFLVDRSRCSTEPMPRRRGTVVASELTASSGLVLTQSLVPGETVRLTWSLGLPKILDTIGGNPMLVQDGRLAAGPCSGSSFCLRHPRTGAGFTLDGRLLLVVVDGRWKRSVGMTPAQFARLFRYLGAENAINLDGGGSSTMVVHDEVVNRPSDGFERGVGNALLVLPYPDAEEPPMAASPPPTPTPYLTPTAYPTPTPTPSSSSIVDDLPVDGPPLNPTAASACAAAQDPASIGGYLDLLMRTSRVPLGEAMRRTLSIFRGNAPKAC